MTRQDEARRMLNEKKTLVDSIARLMGQFEASNGVSSKPDAESWVDEFIEDMYFDDIKDAHGLIECDAPCHKDFQSFHDAREA